MSDFEIAPSVLAADFGKTVQFIIKIRLDIRRGWGVFGRNRRAVVEFGRHDSPF